MATASIGVPGCHYSCECDGPVGDCCVGGWVQPLAGNTILPSEFEIGGVRLLGHQITSPPEQSFASIK